MSTKLTRRENGTDKEELPATWTEVKTTELARFEHTSGAVIRIRSEMPTRSAAEFNAATHTDATGQIRTLYHAEELPSEARELHAGGTEQDAREAALAFITNRCPEHDRELTTDAAGCLFCPACTEADR